MVVRPIIASKMTVVQHMIQIGNETSCEEGQIGDIRLRPGYCSSIRQMSINVQSKSVAQELFNNVIASQNPIVLEKMTIVLITIVTLNKAAYVLYSISPLFFACFRDFAPT